MTTKTKSSVLVVSDRTEDALLIQKLLSADFEGVTTSTLTDRAAAEFDAHQPDVLVLAFDALYKAENYYLSVLRLSAIVQGRPHRTVVLCSKDELQEAYALCRKQQFDDYVLFWPMAQDALRLPLAVHQALRQVASSLQALPSASQFAAEARQLQSLDTHLAAHVRAGDVCLDDLEQSLRQDATLTERAPKPAAEAPPAATSRAVRPSDNGSGVAPPAKPADAVVQRLQPVRDWAASLPHVLVSELASVRALSTLARRVRPLLLLVDDDLFQHKLVRNLLRDEYIDLAFASSAARALASLDTRRPDVILMDVDMPEMDGVEATTRIKAMPALASVPVLMLTGHSNKEIVIRSARAKAAGFIVKPFSKNSLLDKVNECLVSSGWDFSR